MVSNLDRYRASATDEQMQATVLDICRVRGGRLFHLRDARRAPELEDLPDWIVIAPWLRTVYLIEAKSQKRVVTAGQREVLDLLAECTRVESGIVRAAPKPGEIEFERFQAMLKGEA